MTVFPGGIVDGTAIDALSTGAPENPDLVWAGLLIQGPTNYPKPLLTIRTGATE